MAGGDQQDQDLYGDLSSPTAGASALLAVAAIAAAYRGGGCLPQRRHEAYGGGCEHGACGRTG